MDLWWKIASTLLALWLYLPLARKILSGESEQNLATWILWAALDGTVACALFWQNGNYFLTVAYTFGSIFIVTRIWKSGKFAWTWLETLSVILVLMGLVVWYYSGPRMATIVVSVSVIIAGIPQVVESWREPEKTPWTMFFGWFMASVFSIAGGKDWSVGERFYPICAGSLSLLIAILGVRARFRKEQVA